MPDLSSIKFKQLDLSGMKILVSWARAEGWNPGSNDAAIFYNTDPEGFYGYYHNDELIAGGSVVSYDGAFGFMGFFIVRPEYRSAGIGRRLWYLRRDTLLARLKPGAPIGMDGVVAMQPFYHKGGFNIAFRDERREKIGMLLQVDERITTITSENIPAILAYDQQCFGYVRSKFMQQWLTQQHASAFKFMDDSILQGFAVLRKADKGYKIGPLFADNSIIAEELYKACLNAVPGEWVYLDIPTSNVDAVALTKKYETTYVFECARMYLGQPPNLPVEKIFGITSFELG